MPDEYPLGRIAHFDSRSRDYPIRALLPRLVARRKRTWSVDEVLDQGREGACVGFGWSYELAATPVPYPGIDDGHGFALYQAARIEDRAMGNVWSEGASVLAGAKVLHKSNRITQYRWGFSVNDVVDTLIIKGPVVLGINWYRDMYTPQDGVLQVSGALAGGHCILARGYHPAHPQFGEVVVLRNSWGSDWGNGGDAWLRVSDLARLLSEQGEACIATDKRLPRAVVPSHTRAEEEEEGTP